MSSSRKALFPCPTGFAESAARSVATWVNNSLPPVLVGIESEDVCHGVMRVTVSYSPAITVKVTLFERGLLDNQSGGWEIVGGEAEYNDSRLRRKQVREFSAQTLRSLQPSFPFQGALCTLPVTGTVYVICNKKTGKAFRRLKEHHLYKSESTTQKYEFRNVQEFEYAQLAAAARAAEFEAEARKLQLEKKLETPAAPPEPAVV